MKNSINIMVNRIATTLADNNPTILLYGSATLDDFKLGWSDIDILCLTEKSIDKAQANKLVNLRQVLMDEYTDNPYFRLFEGGFISEKYAKTTNKKITSAGWILDITRCLYTVKTGGVIAKTAAAEWALSENLVPNVYVMQRAIKIRKNPELYISDVETLEWIGTLGPFIQEFADVLEKELLKQDKPKYLYHGSQHKTDLLTPHTASGLPEENGTECGIYAYENIDDVLPFTLVIRPYGNGRKSFHVDDSTGIITISAGVLDETAQGYIYKMMSDDFEKLDEKQWISRIPVVPVEVITVGSKDIMNKVILTGSAEEIKNIF